MQKMKHIMRTGVLYVAAIVLAGFPSVAVHAEDETYYYDQASGRWNSSKWTYDAPTNTYIPAVPLKPSPSPAPEQSTDTKDSEASPSKEDSSADSSAAVNSTGPSSNNQVKDDNTPSSQTDIKNKTTIDNTENSDAKTGNAGVKQNSNGGDAKTGNASVDTTIINTVHSTVGKDENSGIARFTVDYYGDVNGDIVIGPNVMGNAQVDKTTNINSDTNVNNDSSITNNINLNAQSGNAEVNGNTVAGSAQSGDARAVANLLNLVNTVIAANQSFVGTINIHGNLNGNILLSPEFIPQLLASNANNVIEVDFAMPLSTNITDDHAIVNNIDLQATSGTATVKDNTSAGSAQSGEAQTKLQILNLTGHEVIADDALLVFVNVGGKWVGMITDAPGATAAAFGSGVSSHKVNAASDLDIDNKTRITNNINVAAATGDAEVSSNTSGGNAKTGNAFAGANIANISNSTFNILKSMRYLFINISNDWIGMLKFEDPKNPDVITGVDVLAASEVKQPAVGAPNVKLGFIPRVQDDYVNTVTSASKETNKNDPYVGAVLASASNAAPLNRSAAIPTASPRDTTSEMVMMGVGLAVAAAGTALASGKSGFFIRRNRQ